MPWPNFTELSFGYCFLRELESLYTPTGKFPMAPDFISQNDEKLKGYDTEVMVGTSPLFFQFKRSFILTTANATPFKDRSFSSLPIFRMHYHDNDLYSQHKALLAWEASGHAVYYVTSQIADHHELSALAISETIIEEGSVLFFPSEATPPNYSEDHCICYTKNSPHGVIYSEKARVFKRRIRSIFDHFAQLPNSADRNERDNETEARFAFNEILNLTQSEKLRGYLKKIDDPVKALSIAAFLILNVNLTYVRTGIVKP